MPLCNSCLLAMLYREAQVDRSSHPLPLALRLVKSDIVQYFFLGEGNWRNFVTADDVALTYWAYFLSDTMYMYMAGRSPLRSQTCKFRVV